MLQASLAMPASATCMADPARFRSAVKKLASSWAGSSAKAIACSNLDSVWLYSRLEGFVPIHTLAVPPILLRNPQRFLSDPLRATAESRCTFQTMLGVLAKHRPSHFMLENVQGCRPRA